MSNKSINKSKTKSNKSIKKPLIIIVAINVVLLLILIILTLPLIIAIPSIKCEGLKTIGKIENRKVYSYCTNVISIPTLNKKMTTDEILKGTVQTEFIWDGGTSVNQGVGYIIIDCSDNLSRSRKSPLIITKRRYKDQALYKCSDYVKSKSDNN